MCIRDSLKFVTDERFLEPGGYGGHRRAVILTSWIVRRITDYKNITKEIVLVLCEAVDSALNIIFPHCRVECGLQPGVVSGLNRVGYDRSIRIRAHIGRVVVVIKGRYRQQ